MLENKVNILQSEIKNLLTIITNNNNEKNTTSKSSTCSCGKKSGDKKLISTGTNTSLDNINYNAEKSASNKNNSSHHQIMNINQNNSLLNSLNNHKNKQEEEDDKRYEAFLNENSINFPKQFLDLENKESESLYEENSITIKNNQINKDINTNKNKTDNFTNHSNLNNPPRPNTNYNNSTNAPLIKINQTNSLQSNTKNSFNDTKIDNYVPNNKVVTPTNDPSLIVSNKESFSHRKIDYLKKYDETFGKNKMLTSI